MELLDLVVSLYASDLSTVEKDALRKHLPKIELEDFHVNVDTYFDSSYKGKIERIKAVRQLTGFCSLHEAKKWIEEHYTYNGNGEWVVPSKYVVGELYRMTNTLTDSQHWVVYKGNWQGTEDHYFESIHTNQSMVMSRESPSHWKVQTVEEYIFNKLQNKLDEESVLKSISFGCYEDVVTMKNFGWDKINTLSIKELGEWINED